MNEPVRGSLAPSSGEVTSSHPHHVICRLLPSGGFVVAVICFFFHPSYFLFPHIFDHKLREKNRCTHLACKSFGALCGKDNEFPWEYEDKGPSTV